MSLFFFIDISRYTALSDVKVHQIATVQTSDPSIDIQFYLEVNIELCLTF